MKFPQSHKMSRSRVLTWVLAGTFLSIIGVSIFTYISYQRAASDLVVERDRQLIYLSAAQLKEEMSKYTEVLESIARNEDILSGIGNIQRERLKKSALRLAVFDGGVIMLDNFGRVVASVPERADIHYDDWSDRSYFRQLLISSTEFYSNILPDGPEGSNVVVISVPVFGGRGEFIGALAGMFRLDETSTSSFYASIVRLRLGQNGSIYILDGNERLIYNTSAAFLGAEMEASELSWLEMQSETGALRTRDGAGNDVVVAYAGIPGTTWTLITKDDWKTLTSTTAPYTNILLAMLGLGMLLPASLVAVILRRRDREIQSFERVHQEFNLVNQLHRLLTPPQTPLLPGWTLSVSNKTFEQPENDFYDFMFLPNGNLMISIGTINLAGIPALVTHSGVRANLRNAAFCGFPPGEALERTNAVLFPDLKPGQTVECLYAILEPGKERLTYSSAGIRFIAKPSDPDNKLVQNNSQPLGSAMSAVYRTGEFHIPRGSGLMLISNGLFESKDAHENNMDREMILDLLAKKDSSLQWIADNILYHYRDFVKDTLRQAQDVTLITIEHQPDKKQREVSGKALVLQKYETHER